VHAGEVEAVHAATTTNVYRQQLVPVDGQADVLTMGLPYICPYNVNSIMNPILVMCLGLGYFFNLYRNKPLVREGGVLIMSHPTPWEFHPVHHPSYIDFFEQVLAETTDPAEIEAKFEEDFATDPWFEGDPDKNYNKRSLVGNRELVRPVKLFEEGKPHAEVSFDICLERA